MESRFLNVGVIVSLICMFLMGCATNIRVSRREQVEIIKNSTIVVASKTPDFLAAASAFEQVFTEYGFTVISSMTNRTSLKYAEQTSVDEGNVNTRAKIAKETETKARYLFEFSYNTRMDIPLGTVIQNLHGSFTDLESGKIIATAGYNVSEFGGSTADEVARQILSKLIGPN